MKTKAKLPEIRILCGTILAAFAFCVAAAPFLPASAETVRTRYGTAEYVKHVPDSKTQVAAVLYALTGDIGDAARCPVAKLNARGYGVVMLDCTKLSGDRGAAWAAAIKAVKAALASDRDIDADAIGVVLDKTERHVKSTADAMRERAAELILKYGDKANGATK